MKLDIQRILRSLDHGDMRLYDTISSDASEKKQLDSNISWLIPQWMTGSSNPTDHRNSIKMFDIACNPVWKSLYHHPELQTKMLAVIGNGSIKHKFFRPSGNRKSNIDALYGLLQIFYDDIKQDEVVMYFMNANIDDVNELMDRAGILPENRSGICKQYKTLMKKQ